MLPAAAAARTPPPPSAKPPPPEQRGGGGDNKEEASSSSVLGSALLVSGTAIGAGILALPAVTQDAGFGASAAALVGGAAYSAATGLLLAELYVNAASREGGNGSSGSNGSSSGSNGSSDSGTAVFADIAQRTLGGGAVTAGAAAYAFLHVALLVAYVGKAGDVVAAATGLPPLAAGALFSAALGGLCYAAPPRALDAANGALVALTLSAFVLLLAAAAGGVDPDALARADWGAVVPTLPVIALSFVYHNVVPVVARGLGGDAAKIRAAIVGGVALPLAMFLAWQAAVLGSLDSLSSGGGAEAAPISSSSSNGNGGGGGSSSAGGSSAIVAAAAPALSDATSPASPSSQQQQQAQPEQQPKRERARVADPLAALSAADPRVGGAIAAFSLLAVATSYIGFVLGLTDFVAGAAGVPRASPLPWLLTLLPPLALAASFPGVFLAALELGGTYGVLTLFGLLPCAMAWADRYGGRGGDGSGGGRGGGRGAAVELVPGGKPVLLLMAGGAAAIIANEAVGSLSGLLQ